MIGLTSVKQAFKIDVAISPLMADALTTWSAMYANQAEWLSDPDVHSLNLPAAIAGEIARAVTIEMQVEFTGSARATYLQEQFARLMPKMRLQVEYGAAKGGLMMKPYIDGGRITVDFVQADMFYPIAFDSDGDITACVFADQRQVGDHWYTRLEYHNMIEAGCEIINLAFRSSTKEDLGTQVPLAAIDDWADILPQATIVGIDRPLFAYFRYPLANTIDPSSPLGVSCYSRAVDLIEDADVQWSNLLWEFESGKRALFVDSQALGTDKDNNPAARLPLKRLYHMLDTGGSDDALFEEWTPTLREDSVLAGLDAILRKVEFNCGLAYGTLSNPDTVDKTATELKISRQRSYATITDTQKALQSALEQLVWAMDVWATVGQLAPMGVYQTAYQFDDSIVTDTDLQFQQDARLVGMGIMSKVEFRMRNFRETEEVARQKVQEAQGEMQAATDLFAGQEA